MILDHGNEPDDTTCAVQLEYLLWCNHLDTLTNLNESWLWLIFLEHNILQIHHVAFFIQEFHDSLRIYNVPLRLLLNNLKLTIPLIIVLIRGLILVYTVLRILNIPVEDMDCVIGVSVDDQMFSLSEDFIFGIVVRQQVDEV